jgi:hypothetical protein
MKDMFNNLIEKVKVWGEKDWNNNVNEDIYIYNYLMYGDNLKNSDLFKSYYDLYLRNIKNIMFLLDTNI